MPRHTPMRQWHHHVIRQRRARHMPQRLQRRGQPHHHHPHIACHRQRHAPQYLGLLLAVPVPGDHRTERQRHQPLAVGQQRPHVGPHLLTQALVQLVLRRPWITAYQQPQHPGDRIGPLQLQHGRHALAVRNPCLAQRPMPRHGPVARPMAIQPGLGPFQPCSGVRRRPVVRFHHPGLHAGTGHAALSVLTTAGPVAWQHPSVSWTHPSSP